MDDSVDGAAFSILNLNSELTSPQNSCRTLSTNENRSGFEKSDGAARRNLLGDRRLAFPLIIPDVRCRAQQSVFSMAISYGLAEFSRQLLQSFWNGQ